MKEVTGTIELFGIFEFLQLAGFNRRSLVLCLKTPIGQGDILIREGAIIDASFGGQRGVGALFPLLQAGFAGEFQLLPPPSQWPETTISLKTEQILMRVAMSLPPPDDQPACSPDWRIQGGTGILSTEEILQIYESNKRPAVCRFRADGQKTYDIAFAGGGILVAQADGRSGAEVVYDLLVEDDLRFEIASPPKPPRLERILDIAGAVMEGLRRRDEKKMLSSELRVDHNPLAQKTLELLASGELDEHERLQIARRWLPGTEETPAVVIARLTVDASPAVREAALQAIQDMPEPIATALANDPDTPRPLLAYFLGPYDDDRIAATAVLNPSTPVEVIVAQAASFGEATLAALREERRDTIRQERDLRAALRQNPRCTFIDMLDTFDAESRPRLRKKVWSGEYEPVDAKPALVLERPPEDPNKEKVSQKVGPRDIAYIAKRGSLRQKMELVCGNSDDIAVEIVSQPGLPESFLLGVAESKGANSAALRHIAGNRSAIRNGNILHALLFNPKTPVAAATSLMNLVRPDLLSKLETSRDVPDGTRQNARQLLEKRKKQPKK